MAAVELGIDDIGRKPVNGEGDIDSDEQWVSLGVELSASRAQGATIARIPDDSPLYFVAWDAVQVASRPADRLWNFKNAPRARLAIARDKFMALAGEAGSPFELRGTLTIFWREAPRDIPFRLAISPVTSRFARPSLPSHFEPCVIDFDRDDPGADIPVLEIEFGAPEFPALARRSSPMFVKAELARSDGAPIPLAHGLSFQLIPRSGESRVDYELVDAADSGLARFDLEYSGRRPRFDPSGLAFGVAETDLVEAARAGDRRLELIARLYDESGGIVAICRRELRLEGDVSDRVVFTWLARTRKPRTFRLPLDGDGETIELPGIFIERFPDGQFDPERRRLNFRVEPADAEVGAVASLESDPSTRWDLACPRAEPGEWSIDAPTDAWIKALGGAEALGPSRRGALAVTVDAARAGKSKTFHFVVPLQLSPRRPDWIACVDYGASSTAIWLGEASGTRRGQMLRLGRWLREIDRGGQRFHDAESDEILLPSYVGLSSDLHLRANFDPLSLGDLALALPDRAAAEERLKALDLAYDVSVPFPSRARLRQKSPDGGSPDYLGAIVHELKRILILDAARPRAATPVLRRRGANAELVEDIDPGELLGDVFAELGRYVAVRALALDARQGALADVAEARRRGDAFLAVVTHPCGVTTAMRETYRRAGDRFANAFSLAASGDAGARVILVPEALAAAQFGMEKFAQDRTAADETAGDRYFVTLDIGAGTFDASVISRRAAQRAWNLEQHFGVPLGGGDIDREIVERLAAILARASEQPGFEAQFELAEDLASPSSASRFVLAAQFQAAKAQLSSGLPRSGPDFDWRREDLEITVGVVRDPAGEAWPVAFRSRGARDARFEGEHWSLAVEPSETYGQEAKLRIRPNFFAHAPADAGGLALLTRLLGAELPGMAIALAPDPSRAIVIVTGRAALWPPLHAMIKATAASMGAALARPAPYAASEMKGAVVAGAVTLASHATQAFEAEADLENPRAIITFKANTDFGPSARRIDEITVLPNVGEPERELDIGGAFYIASIIPGLDRRDGREQRLRLFDELAKTHPMRPYIILSPEYQVPGHFSPGRYRVETLEAGTRVAVKFTPLEEAAAARTIPIQRMGRVYG